MSAEKIKHGLVYYDKNEHYMGPERRTKERRAENEPNKIIIEKIENRRAAGKDRREKKAG